MIKKKASQNLSCALVRVALSLAILFCVFRTNPETLHAQEHDGTHRRIHVPILMYHYVGSLPEDADDIRVNLTVAAETFEEHLQYLAAQGYTTITLQQLIDALHWGAALPPKPIILTFDDGHLDHFVHVLPALQRHGFIGTFFIVTGFADRNLPQYMSWAQIQHLNQAGMEIAAHTKDHIDLRERDVATLTYQVVGSQQSLEAHLGLPILSFSYPVGNYDEATLRLVESTTIEAAVTTRPGALHTSTDPLLLPRLRVSNGTGVPGLAQLLRFHGAP